MNENERQSSDQDKQPAKSKAGVILIPVIILLQIIIIYFVVAIFIAPDSIKMLPNSLSKAKLSSVDPNGIGEVHVISALTVNPIDSNGRRFAVFEIALECESKGAIELIKRYEPKIKDEFIAYLRSKTVDELSLPSAMEATKKQLRLKANRTIGDDVVHNVYFTEYVLQ